MSNFPLIYLLTLTILSFGLLSNISNAQIPTEPGLRIVTPPQNSSVPIGELSVEGVSTDNATTDCQVSVDINDVKPYQNASATGPEGEGDFSNWTYTFTSNYSLVINGINEITSRMICFDGESNATKYYSRNVTGVSSDESLDEVGTLPVSFNINAAQQLIPKDVIATNSLYQKDII